MTNYLYHKVPNDLEGNIIYPLNQLETLKPNLYKIKVAKYEGRKKIMETVIPQLNCLWNDVIFLTAVPPKILKEALMEAGMPEKEMVFYQIDPTTLAPENTLVWKYKNLEKKLIKLPEDELISFNPSLLPGLSTIPETTKIYFKEKYDNNERPLVFHGVPHVLYKGTLDITDLPIVSV